ncbi:MAG: ATP-dependent zinc metalloprotease FtsH [Ruminococcaceae bacterium]|nr:ATP-dependent zinc metalloprotease FtsH [Oscillospiraceae bacterium]
MKSNLKVILGYVLAFVVIFGVILLVYQGTTGTKKPLTYGDILDHFYNEDVATYKLDYNKNTLTIQLFERDEQGRLLDSDGAPVTPDANGNYPENVTFKLSAEQVYKLADIKATREEIILITAQQEEAGVGVGILSTYENTPANVLPWWVSLIPWILIIVVFILLYSFAMKQMMKGAGPGSKTTGFGKSHVKMPTDDKNKITFRDVAGADEEKEELVEIVDYLKAPAKFARLGARIPHGVLLMGPPGTGKTLLAKAVAGEAGVPFFSISGSDFVEMYVGVGASRVRDLFDTARKAGSAIIFIDEIDAVGRQRGTGLGGGHDEREQTLNQLLVEMDGFGSHEGIVVIAATNRADVLDPALLRPGRFDRQITVNRPNIKGREDILKVHARNKPLEPGVDLSKVAKITVGFTGADLANLLNEAALLSARHGKSLIGMDEIEAAFNKIVMGPKKKTWVMSDEDKKLTAYHEAGHAIVGHLTDQDPVHLITIVPTGRGAGGYTSFRPEADSYYDRKSKYEGNLAMGLGGRAAEEIIFGDVTSGASSDIQHVTDLAKYMVTRLGMSEKVGLRSFGTDQGQVFLGRDFSTGSDHSDATAALIDEEIHVLISEAYDRAKAILLSNIGKLHFISEYLLEHEDMDGDLFKAVMESDLPCGKQDPLDPTVTAANEELNAKLSAMLEEKEKESREANEKRAQAEAARRVVERALADDELDSAKSEDEDEESDEQKSLKNPFDYSPENNEGNPFDYNDSNDHEGK